MNIQTKVFTTPCPISSFSHLMSTPKIAGLCSSVVVLPARAPARLAAPKSPSRHELHFTSCFAFTDFFFSPSNQRRRPPPPANTLVRKARRIPSCSEYVVETERTSAGLRNLDREARIRKQLQEPDFSPSSYDTAWVAMVPMPGSSLQAPCFPQCVEWILQNQHGNGSWGHGIDDESDDHSLTSPNKKDIILSTLACVVALKKWNVGPKHIMRGLEYIGNKFSAITDEKIAAPIGFDLSFPAMLSLAIQMGLEFPVRETSIDLILNLYEMKLKRLSGEKSCGKEAYLAYVAEGAVNQLDWNEVMKFQRKNGSLFNSPSTTAAALVHNYDDKALQYLNLLVSKFGSAVPTLYPQNIHCQLSMVDTLEKMGISHYFSTEIKGILDMTYSFWLQRDEEIMLDIETCAMSFRLLRLNGYDFSSDELSHVAKASTFAKSHQGYLNDTKSILELYKASKVSLSENELILENIGSWSGSLLREKLCSDEMQRTPIYGEYAVKFPIYATIVEPLDHKWNIEHFDARDSQMLKTKNMSPCVNQDILSLAIEDFRFCQSVYQDELQLVKSWEKENRMDQLGFVRQRLTYCYMAAATTIYPHKLSDARIACAKSILLTIAVDDFFDVGGSKEEQENLIELVEKWDEHQKDDFYSEKVEIVFSALYTTVNQLGAMASAVQKRDVTKHLVGLWLQVVTCMMTESEWQRSQSVPTVEEYMTNAVFSFALAPIILPAQYFLGEMLTEHMVKHEEYNQLSRLMFTCSRLLNDTRTVERESRDGKLNSVSLLVLHSGGSMSLEQAKEATHNSLASSRRDLLGLVLREDTVVPKACKELFWKLCKTIHLFYFQIDGFTSPEEMVSTVNAVIKEPLKLKASNPSLLV